MKLYNEALSEHGFKQYSHVDILMKDTLFSKKLRLSDPKNLEMMLR